LLITFDSAVGGDLVHTFVVVIMKYMMTMMHVIMNFSPFMLDYYLSLVSLTHSPQQIKTIDTIIPVSPFL